MQQIAPLGPVYQAGTLSGNPVAMAAGLKTLELISADGFYDKLSQMTTSLLSGLKEKAKAAGIALTTNQAGAMFGIFFTDAEQVSNYAQVGQCNLERFKKFYHGMLDAGVYLAPSAYEAGFVSSAHTEADIDQTLSAAEKVFAAL
jgi:glutamate-1-semialdehyde 2,1-aminomutase